MELEILYFAAVRELVGVDTEHIEVPAAVTTVRALREHLEALHEPLAGRLGHVRIAVNEEMVRDGDPVRAGDVVALIPPVAGG